MYYLLHWLFIGLVFLSRCSTILSAPQKISFLFINDNANQIATNSLDSAIKYFQSNPDLNVEIEKDTRLFLDKDDPKELLEAICAKYDEATQAGDTPVILDATRSGMFSESIKAFTNSLKLPTVSTSYGTPEDLRHWAEAVLKDSSYLVQIRPPGDLIPEIIKGIVTAQNIKNAGILFDESYVMDHKYSSLLRNIPTRHMIRPISSSGSDISARLDDFIEHRIFNYFILGSMKTISITLEIAERKGYFNTEYAWNFLTEDTEELTNPPCSGTCKFLFLSPVIDPDLTNRISPLKIEDKPYLVSVFFFEVYYKTFLAVKALKDSGNWPKEFIYKQCSEYKDNTNGGDIQVDLRSALRGVTKIWYSDFLFGNRSAKMNFKMNLELIQYNNGPKKTHLLTWDAGDAVVNLANKENISSQAAIIKYKIVTRLQKPFMMKEVDENGVVNYVGYCRDLLEEIRKQMHSFEFEIYEVEDNEFGSLQEDNVTWSGLIGDLIEKKADIALSSLSVMAERENVIDFTVPYYDLVGYTILMKKPTQPTSLFKFLTVLEKTVWLCILAAYFFTSFLMWVFDRWSPYSFQNNREKYKDDEEKREFTLKECLWFCMTSLTPQGGGEAPKNLSGRLVAATWWLFGFIIIASYTANLAAFLTVSRLDTPVESLEDLSKQYKILYAPINNSDAMVYFERMSSIEHRFYEIWKDMSLNDSLSEIERAKLAVWDYPVSDKYTKIWQAMNEADFPKDLETAVKRVQDSNDTHGYAFIGDATDIRYLALTNCDLQMVGDEFSRKPYALATQQGSPLKDSLNNAILQLLNKRKLEKLKETWWKETVECDKTDEQTDGISIQNIGGVFIVIFVGIGMACMTLVFEYWWYKYRKNPNLIEVGPVNASNRVQGPEKTKSDLFGGFRNRNIGPIQQRLGNTGITNQW